MRVLNVKHGYDIQHTKEQMDTQPCRELYEEPCVVFTNAVVGEVAVVVHLISASGTPTTMMCRIILPHDSTFEASLVYVFDSSVC